MFIRALPLIPTAPHHLATASPFPSQNPGFFSSAWSPDQSLSPGPLWELPSHWHRPFTHGSQHALLVSPSLCPGHLQVLWDLPDSSVQSLSRVFVIPWTAARQAPLSINNSRSLLKLMFIESVMPSNHLILCRPLLLLPSIFPSIRVLSFQMSQFLRWPKYWSFSFSISPSNEYPMNRINA